MMKRTKNFLVLLLLGAFIGSFWGRFSRLSDFKIKKEQLSLLGGNTKTLSQQLNERQWKKVRVTKIFSILRYSKGQLLMPTSVKIFEDSIYILDPTIPALLKYDSSGKFITKFGNNKGKGPGELMQPLDFSVSDRFILITDVSTSLVNIFNKDAKFLYAIRTKFIPSRVTLINDTIFAISETGIGGKLSLYNLKGKMLRTFSPFFEKEIKYAWPEDFFITSGTKGNIYGVFFHGSYIFSFNSLGKSIFFTETIDKFPFPQVNIYSSDVDNRKVIRASIDHNVPVSALSISISNDTLYVLAGSASKKAKGIVIDAYMVENGKYLYSFKFNKSSNVQSVGYCFVYKGYLYLTEILNDGNSAVTKYKFDFE
ncbi:6-bladed beta-propeller [Melioribacteraceae bacterium 4301-Me]|uniref:6-bladed beta-propeller n=1 Tax=Pyranulibacter aquaticus TaxID=3163344 RepID=UPI00359BCE63